MTDKIEALKAENQRLREENERIAKDREIYKPRHKRG